MELGTIEHETDQALIITAEASNPTTEAGFQVQIFFDAYFFSKWSSKTTS